MPKKSTPSSTPITSTRHTDKRANIPTPELSGFVSDDEKAPTTILYPRDPSLDPQLVWRGKDEQDRQDLAVPAVPVYIQEKIQPQAIIENLRAHPSPSSSHPSSSGRGAGGEGQLQLFADFNHLDFQEMVDFYHHEQNWSNRMILGDSLLVMTSLAEKEGLKGKVQMIYIDPPYGVKFGSNWQVSTRKLDVKDGRSEDATRQPEQVKAFRDTWELGIHSYLSYLRDRFIVARELLTESGSIFVQIGDENVHLVRCVLDEVFGSDNFISQIIFRKKLMPLGGKTLESMSDFLLWYAKDAEKVKYRQLYLSSAPDPSARWTGIELFDGVRRSLSTEERANLAHIPSGSRVFSTVSQAAPSFSETGVFTWNFEGRSYSPPKGQCWVTSAEKMNRLAYCNRVLVEGGLPRYIMFHEDFPLKKLTNPWNDTAPTQGKIYVVQTNESVIARCLLMTTDPGDLVLDPTCGSGTTAYVAEQWGRRWITIDTSRVAIALARTRLMAGRFPYYLLSDTPEGLTQEAVASAQLPPSPLPPTTGDIKKGFVYRRVPHITLKSIANNAEIDAIHAKYQPDLEALRAQINALAGRTWEEWEIPRDIPSNLTGLQNLTGLFAQWWTLRRKRQQEMDASISRHADTELLYDQPYEDSKRIRVSGPFTVESLSPHRVIATEEERPASEEAGQKAVGAGQFETMILDNLRKAGVQNTRKNERLTFDRLDTYAGVWLHAAGEYHEKEGALRRVAVCIGPEHGTVGPELIKEAAKEAMRGAGFDLLIVCGFAFDPFVSEEVRNYGKLTVLPVRMNPDLAMGDELLKKTGTGNLFMVFGEPDIQITPCAEDQITVTIRGVDVYDPTTGEIRSSTTDDIACWFIDTDYNEESFFVRHAYFTGAGDPYDKLKRALRAEIDEAAWSQLYATTSLPFARPPRGKIAIKVINHYGDEVLKVYALP